MGYHIKYLLVDKDAFLNRVNEMGVSEEFLRKRFGDRTINKIMNWDTVPDPYVTDICKVLNMYEHEIVIDYKVGCSIDALAGVMGKEYANTFRKKVMEMADWKRKELLPHILRIMGLEDMIR